MKVTRQLPIACLALGLAFVLELTARVFAASTITATNRYAYGASIGWLDARADTNNGAVIGEYVCAGFIYAANVGWISLGSGAPANAIQYQNNSESDFGVNHDGQGNLRGYAYGANIGWICFEATGAPRVDLSSGRLGGHVWSANCGWILLSNSLAHVQTGGILAGPLARNGLPVAWLMENFQTTGVSVTADPDGDGMSNSEEYWAGTDPNSPASNLRITQFTHGEFAPTYTTLNWSSVPTRFYAVQICDDLAAGGWHDFVVLPWPGANNLGWDDFSGQRFCRIRAFRPLMQ